MTETVYLISQRRRDGTFPGLHKVILTGFRDMVVEGDTTLYRFERSPSLIFESREEAQQELDILTRKIGPFYSIFEAQIDVSLLPVETPTPTLPDSGKAYREAAFAGAAPMTETDKWRAVNPRDVSRIDCDRKHMCGEQAVWATRTTPFFYVCDYHRRVFETTGTFWKDEAPK